ncbi:CGNR zinc finger domain-containing protein [Nocardioides sp. SYSU DS0663]|uniref:CGNR zinc finger domain-containing protein n=1 Tax=Nocardioides sp. SYSU DS0663 TaxID=3416445 RepID=UPI003F4C60C4
MVFAHDTEQSLLAAVTLVNTAEPPEGLDTVADLDAFYARFEYSGRRERTGAELEEVRALRPHLRRLLMADRDHAAELVNAVLAEARAVPRLVRHDRFDWHLHAVAHEAPLATRINVETAMAMVDVIRADEHSRLGVCADTECDGLVLDLSRNRSRRFCSTACGNRHAVAAYRARQSAGAPGAARQ